VTCYFYKAFLAGGFPLPIVLYDTHEEIWKIDGDNHMTRDITTTHYCISIHSYRRGEI